MKIVLALLALLALGCSASDVLDLTVDNYDEVIAANSPIMVEFFAPWCGHCKHLAPEYEKAATALKEKGIKLAKVDATVEELLAQKNAISGFPTLKVYKNGVYLQDYRGPRTAAGIIAYMEKKAAAPYTQVASADEVEAALAQEKNGVVVGYFSDLESEEFLEFAEVADSEMHIKFLVVSDAAAAAGCMASEADNSVTVLSKDGSKHAFTGDIEKDLAAFVTTHAFPQIMTLDPELFGRFVAQQITVAAISYPGDDWTKALKKVAATQPSIRIFDTDVQQWGQQLVRMGVISGTVYPTFVAWFPNQDVISWDESVPVTDDALAQWFADLIAGTAKPWIKSEAVPTSNDGPVKVVVAKTFDEIVLDKTKNVLVKFYAPWCGHCKNMAPVYEELGSRFQNDDSVVIAKIDATANHVDKKYGVQGFPTLIFFPSGEDAEFVKYEGSRTLDDMVEFIDTNKN